MVHGSHSHCMVARESVGEKIDYNAAQEVAKLKQKSGKDMVIWGSISFDMKLLNTKPFDRGTVLLAYAHAKAR